MRYQLRRLRRIRRPVGLSSQLYIGHSFVLSRRQLSSRWSAIVPLQRVQIAAARPILDIVTPALRQLHDKRVDYKLCTMIQFTPDSTHILRRYGSFRRYGCQLDEAWIAFRRHRSVSATSRDVARQSANGSSRMLVPTYGTV